MKLGGSDLFYGTCQRSFEESGQIVKNLRQIFEPNDSRILVYLFNFVVKSSLYPIISQLNLFKTLVYIHQTTLRHNSKDYGHQILHR
jgi:hypothetical protein